MTYAVSFELISEKIPMVTARVVLAAAGIFFISLTANVFLVYKYFSHDAKPEIRTVTVDEAVVMRTKGGLLEVSTINATELFESAQDHTILGIPLAKTIARIRVPAVYRYHIELAPEWKIVHRDDSFFVVTPPVKPSLPVAIDTARLESESLGAWSVFTGSSLLVPMQRSITQALATKSTTPKYIELQREIARKTVAEFVEKWLVTQEKWKAASGGQIRVFFADEPIQALGSTPVTSVSSP